jgi:NADH dehydrogenase
MRKITEIRVDFSLKREVFFVVIGSVVGAVTFVIPKAIFEVEMGLPYYLTWIAFGHVVGVYSSESVIAGIGIHMLTAISIGIVVGIFLYKTGILNISKLSNSILYGLFAGSVVFVVFFIPVYQFVLAPEIANTMKKMNLHMTQAEDAYGVAGNNNNNFVTVMFGSVITHLVFGVTLGLVSYFLSVRFGSRYRCSKCDISFSRIDSYQKHIELVHGAKPIQQKRILILGGSFAGVEVLKRLQKAFQNDVSIDITLVSKDNFFLFTPMLPEVSSGMIETRHITTPIRAFCKRAKFYEANVESIDLKNNKREVVLRHAIRNQINSEADLHSHTLKYDYLVLALGGKINFFDMADIEKNSFTIKSLGDAIILRNHVISMLERADLEHDNYDLRKSFMTFVVVGGGFSGVETVGEINDFVRDSINEFYHNIEEDKDVRIILVSTGERILPEVSEDLGKFALQKLKQSRIEVLLNSRVTAATVDSVKLNDGSVINSHTLIWAGGVISDPLVANLQCDHDKAGRIIVDNYLQVDGYSGVFAIGDCASIIDLHTGKPCPPTAQHAIREGKVAASNLISLIKSGKNQDKGEAAAEIMAEEEQKKMMMMTPFDYKTKGVMANIGNRNGVAIISGIKIHGFTAWFLWRTFYLLNLPTTRKKLKVMIDWTMDLVFKPDTSMIKRGC